METYGQCHPYSGRLIEEEKEVVDRMTKNLIPPNLILNEINTMKLEDSTTTLKQIYNCHSRHTLERDEAIYFHGRSGLQPTMVDVRRLHGRHASTTFQVLAVATCLVLASMGYLKRQLHYGKK